MELVLTRKPSNSHCTIGELTVDGAFEAFTLEDVVRDKKVQNETAIPAGRYQVIITFSPHFKRNLPLLLNVPNYEGVRIHPGNYDRDTEGCILVGKSHNEDMLMQSVAAFDPLFEKIKSALLNEEVWITIK